jgi:hypothetical protein
MRACSTWSRSRHLGPRCLLHRLSHPMFRPLSRCGTRRDSGTAQVLVTGPKGRVLLEDFVADSPQSNERALRAGERLRRRSITFARKSWPAIRGRTAVGARCSIPATTTQQRRKWQH